MAFLSFFWSTYTLTMSISSVSDNLVVRPVYKGELSLWNCYMQKHHYLGLKWIAGKSLRYIALLDGEWVALLGS